MKIEDITDKYSEAYNFMQKAKKINRYLKKDTGELRLMEFDHDYWYISDVLPVEFANNLKNIVITALQKELSETLTKARIKYQEYLDICKTANIEPEELKLDVDMVK